MYLAKIIRWRKSSKFSRLSNFHQWFSRNWRNWPLPSSAMERWWIQLSYDSSVDGWFWFLTKRRGSNRRVNLVTYTYPIQNDKEIRHLLGPKNLQQPNNNVDYATTAFKQLTKNYVTCTYIHPQLFLGAADGCSKLSQPLPWVPSFSLICDTLVSPIISSLCLLFLGTTHSLKNP